jgi:hypothetical protein
MKNVLATLLLLVAETFIIAIFEDPTFAETFFTTSSLTMPLLILNRIPLLCFIQSQLYKVIFTASECKVQLEFCEYFILNVDSYVGVLQR